MVDLNWLRARDAGLSALRRAGRAAIVMPSMFAIGIKVLGNPTLATFAAFGSFAMLLLVDFGGTRRERLAAQVSLVAVGSVFVCLGTLASNSLWLAAAAMAVVGFVVLFAGVVSSVLAGATTSLLIGFILPVTLPGPAGSIPDRLFGWLLAGAVSLFAITLLWPTPARDPLRSSAAEACRLLAARLGAEVRFVLAGRVDATELDAAVLAAEAAVTAMRNGFFGTPYRPTGLTSAARTVVRLVDEVVWLSVILDQPGPGRQPHQHPVDPSVCAVKTAAAGVLEHSANLLASPGQSGTQRLAAELARLRQALKQLEGSVITELPVHPTIEIDDVATTKIATAAEIVSSLEPSFRAQELSFAISAIAGNVSLTAAAQQRSWPEQLLGHQPAGIAGPLASAYERAGAHAERHSVWLHNSLRGAAALGVAVAIAELTGVQHSFWVVLGTLSVLRSNALSTGQNVLRGLLGTVAGFVIGGALVLAIGTNTVAFWCLLPPAILFAGLAPAAISFAAGQAGFTVTLLILFNIIAPSGWQVGLVRIEDIAIGCVVSLAVGIVFWPRGAGSALGQSLAEAYTESAEYLRQAVAFGMQRCDRQDSISQPPQAESQRAAAAARRLDDAFRNFLAERGAKRLPLTSVATLITGVAGLRLTADAVLELWTGQDGAPGGDRTAARRELLAALDSVAGWYEAMALALAGGGQVPEPLPHDQTADSRLIQAVRRDLSGEQGQATATAVRMIWTGDHLDAARRLQAGLSEPARAAAAVRPGYQPLRHRSTAAAAVHS